MAELPEQGRARVLTYCGSLLDHCPFNAGQSPSEGLPIMVVDEEIYHRLPSLLIATVDKFAQMPWNGRTAMLFGKVSGYCERHGYLAPDVDHPAQSHPTNKALGLPPAKVLPVEPLRPPDLIIQDELHLISGPLGTLVGLYETAVDHLASWEVDEVLVRPKVIASTATIRRADQQVHSLFLRRLDHWSARIAQTVGARLGYKGQDDGSTVGLLQMPSGNDWSLFGCLNSLRDVEPTVNLVLDDGGLDIGAAHAWVFDDRTTTVAPVEEGKE